MNKYMKSILSIIALILIMVSITGCNNDTIPQAVKIDELEWEAVAEIEEWKSCNESGWEVPEGATVYKEQEEIKSYKIVGYETKYRTEEYQEKIGYYLPTWRPRYETKTRQISYKEEIKEPIYATKYYYTIDRWVVSNIKISLGKGNTTDYSYPEYTCKENERIKDVEYTYLVKFKALDRDISYVVSKEKWEELQVGQELLIEIDKYKTIDIYWDDN